MGSTTPDKNAHQAPTDRTTSPPTKASKGPSGINPNVIPPSMNRTAASATNTTNSNMPEKSDPGDSKQSTSQAESMQQQFIREMGLTEAQVAWIKDGLEPSSPSPSEDDSKKDFGQALEAAKHYPSKKDRT